MGQSPWGPKESTEKSSSNDDEENNVFSLLFQQCVKEGESAVDIDQLMGFIQKLQLGHKEGEEVYDSHGSVSLLYIM